MSLSAMKSTNTFEIVVSKFKANISVEEQQTAMENLNTIVKTFNGFKWRNYFYSQSENQWVDIVLWEDMTSAEKASQAVMKNNEVLNIFELLDETQQSFAYYKKMGSIP